MRKSLTTNNFKDGLIMDINPMQMPNTAYINGLNVTLITKDGNEHILQNDMGNGRVETAYLPEGYIPLGTCSLGGIIYVASYNPLKDKGLIGCFPSPERNISSDEDSELNAELTNSDFQFTSPKNDGTSEEGAQTYYLKKQLWADRQFNPGDKFIVYGSPISGNFEKLWIEREYKDLLKYWRPEEETEPGPEDEPDESEPDPIRADGDSDVKSQNWTDEKIWGILKSHTVRLSIGTITNTGKLIIFSNLKEYNINDGKNVILAPDGKTYPYLIFEYNTPENPQKTDLDDYRSLVSQPYNVFNSKISGQLVLIAELVQFNDFDMTITNKMGEDEDGHKTYEPIFNFNYEGDYPYVPYGAECTFLMTWKDDPTVEDKKENGDYSGESEEEYADYLCHDHDSDLKSDFCEYEGLKYDGYKLDDPFPVKYIYENKKPVQEKDDDGNPIYDDDGNPVYVQNESSIHYLLNKWAGSGFFDNKERNSGGKIRYNIKPSMIWGPVSYLEVNGLIDLDKIGTGYIGITQWRYYNDDSTCTLNWGLEVYEEDGYEVKLIVMRMTRVTGYNENNEEYSFETIDYFVDTYESYFGTFTENIPLNSDYFKIKKVIETIGETTDTGRHQIRPIESQTYDGSMYQLKSNQLYFVDIRIWYQEVDNNEIDKLNPTRHAYRWLYTNSVFNSYYGRSQDFGEEQITFDLKFTPEISNIGLDSPVFTQEYYGEYFKLIKTEGEETSNTNSVIQNEYDVNSSININVELANNYNTFDIDVSTDSEESEPFNKSPFDIKTGIDEEINDVSVLSTIESSYIGNDSADRLKYFSETDENSYTTDIGMFESYERIDGDNVFEIPHTVYYVDNEGSYIKDNTAINNILIVTFNSKLLQTVRAFTKQTQSLINITGMFRPLAYNTETFQEYGLEWAKYPYDGQLADLRYLLNNDRVENIQKGQYTSEIIKSRVDYIYNYAWQFLQIGLFGQIEQKGTDGKSYGYVCKRDLACNVEFKNPTLNKKKKFEGPVHLDTKESIGFHFQSLEACADAWKSLGLTKPIEFFLFYFGGRYDSGTTKDGTDCYCWPNDDLPRMVSLYHANHVRGYPDGGNHAHIIFLTMRDVSGSYYLIPLNTMAVFNFNSEEDLGFLSNNGDLLRFYPGLLSYYGFPHIIAQWLTNIYIYSTTETVTYAYIPLNIYWESLLVSNISIPVTITTDETINLKKVYLKLDDGHSVDLHDMYKIMAEKLGIKYTYLYTDESGNEKLYIYYAFDIINENEKHITEKKFVKMGVNVGDFREDETDILHPNIDYIINNIEDYSFNVGFSKSDDSSGKEMRDVFISAQNTTLSGAVMDWDGETLLKIDSLIKKSSKSLYMRDKDGNVSLASSFIPYKIAYNNGMAIGFDLQEDTNELQLLDSYTNTGMDLNKYFVIDNDKLYLNEDYTPYTGDFKFPIYRENDSTSGVNGGGGNANTYCDGIIDVTILNSLKIPNT